MKRPLVWFALVVSIVLATGMAGYVACRSRLAPALAPGAPRLAPALVPSPSRPQAAGLNHPQKNPKAVTDRTEHYCGDVDPGQRCQHEFTVRNEGDAPLLLERGGTSCKCTMSDLPENEIPPGRAVKVRVASKIESEDGPFRHRATIVTNDPDRRFIDFSLTGEVRTVLSMSRSRIETFSFANEPPPGEEVVIYSLVWDDFTITEIQASVPEATWKMRPADPAVLKEFNAIGGYVLTLQMPPRESGRYPVQIDVTASPPGRPEIARSMHVDYVHEVKTGSILSGEHFQGPTKTLDLGPLYEGEGKADYLVWNVRDKRRPKVLAIQSNPAVLKVALEPLSGGGEGTQSYRVGIEVPREAPPCNFRTEKGWVRITTDNPAAEQIEFKVSFAICPRF